MIQPKSPEELMKEYSFTKFASEGGSSFECSDYEAMDTELKEFLRYALASVVAWSADQAFNKKVDLERELKEYLDCVTDVDPADGFGDGWDQATMCYRNSLIALTESINKKV